MSVKKYRKIPLIVEAIKFDYNPQKCLDFVNVNGVYSCLMIDGRIAIENLESTMIASPGDYIIKGINGEFYPCKKDIFEKSYELVEEES